MVHWNMNTINLGLCNCDRLLGLDGLFLMVLMVRVIEQRVSGDFSTTRPTRQLLRPVRGYVPAQEQIN